MQSVSADFTAEERDKVRGIAHNLLVSWKKNSFLNNRTFTIGVSTIGGNHVIGLNPGGIGGPGIYQYFNETPYVTSLGWERNLNMPVGGVSIGLAEATLDNTSGRFLPDYMRGSSEIFTAILPRRPIIINAGFNFAGIDQTLPQFSGVLNYQPKISTRDSSVQLRASDYIDFFSNRAIDREVMFTGQRTDQVIETLFQSAGMGTAQYSLDQGINTIAFGLFETDTKFIDILNKLVQAENGQLYQDEQGVFRFENRQHWNSAPYTTPQATIYTAEVLEAKAPDEDHIINVVEIKSQIRNKLASQLVYQSQQVVELPVALDTDYFISYDDPMLSVDSVTIVANDSSDGLGTDRSSNVVISKQYNFAKATKFTFQNTHTSTIYITSLQIKGRPAKVTSQIYHRAKNDISVTAYEERTLSIENEYIQSTTWAQSLALMLLQSFAQPENLLEMTIRAKPRLQLGDMISWQGQNWRVYGIKAKLDPEQGFTQDLMLLRANTMSFFRIGISTIGGADAIAS